MRVWQVHPPRLGFAVSFGMRVPAMPLYAGFLIPLLAVMALRLIAMSAGTRRRAVAAG